MSLAVDGVSENSLEPLLEWQSFPEGFPGSNRLGQILSHSSLSPCWRFNWIIGIDSDCVSLCDCLLCWIICSCTLAIDHLHKICTCLGHCPCLCVKEVGFEEKEGAKWRLIRNKSITIPNEVSLLAASYPCLDSTGFRGSDDSVWCVRRYSNARARAGERESEEQRRVKLSIMAFAGVFFFTGHLEVISLPECIVCGKNQTNG